MPRCRYRATFINKGSTKVAACPDPGVCRPEIALREGRRPAIGCGGSPEPGQPMELVVKLPWRCPKQCTSPGTAPKKSCRQLPEAWGRQHGAGQARCSAGLGDGRISGRICAPTAPPRAPRAHGAAAAAWGIGEILGLQSFARRRQEKPGWSRRPQAWSLERDGPETSPGRGELGEGSEHPEVRSDGRRAPAPGRPSPAHPSACCRAGP